MQYYRENKGQNTEVINYQSSKAYTDEYIVRVPLEFSAKGFLWHPQ